MHHILIKLYRTNKDQVKTDKTDKTDKKGKRLIIDENPYDNDKEI